MDKILEELENMKKISERVHRNVKREITIKERENEVKELYEKMQLKMIGSVERESIKKEYEKKKKNLDKIFELKKDADNEIRSDFKDQKKKIVDQIDKEVSGYVKTKQDRENAEKARDEEIENLEKEKLAYMKIALNSKKDIDNILSKLNNGENVNTSRLSDARSEYEANAKKSVEIKHKIEDVKKVQFKSIEENKEEFSDLVYFRSRILHMNMENIDDLDKDEFVIKYGKEPEVRTMADLYDEKGNFVGTGKENEEEKPGQKPEEKPEQKPEQKPEEKPEQKPEVKLKQEQRKINNIKVGDTITIDVSNDKMKLGDAEIVSYKEQLKNKKALMADKDLNINKFFKNNKRKMKNIDYALLSKLKDINKNLALFYLDAISGGSVSQDKTKISGLEALNKLINIEYKFDKDEGILNNFKAKRIARYAHKIGLAEIDGISERSFYDKIKDGLSGLKLSGFGKKPKELTSGKEKTESKKPTIKKDSKNVKDDYKVDGKVVNQLNEVSKKTYAVEKETEDERIGDVKRILKEVNEESKSRKKSEDVKGTQSENKGSEIGE